LILDVPSEKTMTTQAEIEAAAYAMLKTDPVPMGLFEFGEACDLAKAALEAAERVRWQPIETALITSDIDEQLIRTNLNKCYGTQVLAFHVSKEHYRYLAEQVISLREHLKRQSLPSPPEIK
jgi:hypothetical protein